jgi:hypothetical protein
MPPIVAAQAELIAATILSEYTPPGAEAMRAAIEADLAAGRKLFVESDRHTMEVEVASYLALVDRTLGGGARSGKSTTRRRKISWS